MSDRLTEAVERWLAEKPLSSAYDSSHQYAVAIIAWNERNPALKEARWNQRLHETTVRQRWSGGSE